jgi:hypothetical protein
MAELSVPVSNSARPGNAKAHLQTSGANEKGIHVGAVLDTNEQ